MIKAYTWYAVNLFVLILAYNALVLENNGASNVLIFLMWFNFLGLCAISNSADDVIKNFSPRKVPRPIMLIFDLALILAFVYYGYWITAIITILSAAMIEEVYEKSAKLKAIAEAS